MGAFAPPALSEHQGQVPFAPPPLSSHEGPVPQGSTLSRFLDPLNPKHLYDALMKPSEDKNEDPRATFGKNFLHIVSSISDASKSHFEQSSAALDKGDFKSALGHALYAVPVLGQMLDDAHAKFESGDLAGGFGQITALLGPKALHDAAPAIISGVKAGASSIVPAVAAATGKVAASPIARDIAGVFSPRIGRGLDLVSKVRKALASTEPSEPPASTDPKLVLGDAPPTERPAWRQEVIDYLNQLEEHLKAPEEASTPQMAPVIANSSNLATIPSSPVPDSPIPEAYRSTEDTGLQIPQEAMARDAVKNRIVTHLRDAGITNQHLDQLDANPAARDLFWDHIGHMEGIYKDPHTVSAKTIASVRGELDQPHQPAVKAEAVKAEPVRPEVSTGVLQGESLRLAEALRDEMLKSESTSAPKLMDEVTKPRQRRKK